MDAKIQELRLEENHNVTLHVGELIEKFNALQVQMAALERQIREGIATPAANVETKGKLLSNVEPSEKDFRYHTFEQIFREPPAQLKQSLSRYIPLFAGSPEPVVDLGCGRGEFLELLKESGKNAYGVDFSEFEIQKLNSAGLKAVSEDILKHINNLADGSIGGVFSAQVVEHLHPDHVHQMLSGLYRAMKPGSPIVLETVNPLSVFSYHHLFFKDPTHIFPVHPDTLKFMLQYAGFQNVQVHLITPVPEQQKLPEPKKEEFSPAAYEYLQTITSRLNQLLYDSLEYYVTGVRP